MDDAVSDLPPFSDAGNVGVAMGDGICDFCSPPLPTAWIYPCRSFKMPVPIQPLGREPWSDSDWGACAVCAELIEAGERVALSMRSALMHDFGIQPKVIDLFFKNRKPKPRIDVRGQSSELYGEARYYPNDPWKDDPNG